MAFSIREVVEKYVTPGEAADCYVIGGHLLKGANIADHDVVNISKISRLLIELSEKGYLFNTRWWVLQENTPVNITYDPKINQFFGAVPSKELDSYLSCEVLIYLDHENKKLLRYFLDHQQKEIECSVCLSPVVQKKLQTMLDSEGKFSKVKVVEFVWSELPPSLCFYTYTKAIASAYSRAVDQIFSAAKKGLLILQRLLSSKQFKVCSKKMKINPCIFCLFQKRKTHR